MMFFEYGEKEINALKKKDKKLALAIEKIGKIERDVQSDLFMAVLKSIIGQQISTKAQQTIWARFVQKVSEKSVDNLVDPKTVCLLSLEDIQSCGTSFRKAQYLQDFAIKVNNNEFDINALVHLSDEEVIKELAKLKGIGVWTAEMIMIFCMQRPNIFSFGDLAILRGLRILYQKKEITKKSFEVYRKRYSPYCSVASIYLWKIAEGALDLTDPATSSK